MHETRQFDVDEIRSAHRERVHKKLHAISGKDHRYERKPSPSQAAPKEKKEDKERHDTRDLHVVARLRGPVRLALPSVLLTAFLSSLCAFSGFLLAATLLLGCLIGERVHAPPGPPPPAQPQPVVPAAASTAAAVAHPVSMARSPSGAAANPPPSFAGDVELGFPAAVREGVPTSRSESPSSTSPPSGVLVAHAHAPTFDSSRRAADSSFMRSES